MRKIGKMSFEGKTCSQLANGLNFYDLKKTLTPGVILTLPLGYIYIHAYYHSSQTSLLVDIYIYIYLRSQVSVYRTIGPLVSKYHFSEAPQEKYVGIKFFQLDFLIEREKMITCQ